MSKPASQRAFDIASRSAFFCWVALSTSLFTSLQVSKGIWLTTALVVPALFAIAYISLLLTGVHEAKGGGFRSIAAVRQLFSSDSSLAAGWLHYLSFDLFAGTWMARDGLLNGMPIILVLPCLWTTFLVGPAGLLLFLVLRGLSTRHFGLDW